MTEAGQVDRLRVLVDAGIALSSELSLDALLQRIVETAVELTGAGYAALGVIDRTGQALEQFLTTGIDPQTHAQIGELPRGRGILGVLIREARPLRLHDIADDPRSVGFPPNHPPMKSFLGVPIVLRGVAYGNLYLTEKAGGRDFSDEDEELAQLIAAQAAVAIENARLYESSTRWLRQLESLNEIGNALTTELELEPLLLLVAERLQELVGAKLVLIALPDGPSLRVAAVAGESAFGVAGMELALHGSKAGRVLERGRSERIDSVLDDPEIDQQATRRLGVHSALYVPLVARGRTIGVVVAHDKLEGGARVRRGRPAPRRDPGGAGSGRRRPLGTGQPGRCATRRRGAGARACTPGPRAARRDRTGADLDPAGPEAAGADGRVRRRRARPCRRSATSSSRRCRTCAGSRWSSVRRRWTTSASYPRSSGSPRPSASRAALHVDLEAQLGEARLSSEAETTLYRVIQEGLTNIVKHAAASRVSILLQRKDSSVVAVVEDDGAGFDPRVTRDDALGLAGMRERVLLAGGRLQVESAPGAGTTLVAEVPAR